MAQTSLSEEGLRQEIKRLKDRDAKMTEENARLKDRLRMLSNIIGSPGNEGRGVFEMSSANNDGSVRGEASSSGNGESCISNPLAPVLASKRTSQSSVKINKQAMGPK